MNGISGCETVELCMDIQDTDASATNTSVYAGDYWEFRLGGGFRGRTCQGLNQLRNRQNGTTQVFELM